MEKNISNLIFKFWDKFVEWFPHILASLILLIIGIWFIRFFSKRIKKSQKFKTLDPAVGYFSITALKITLYIILFITIAASLGIPMTSFIAIIGSVGIALGLAMQSHISNVAAAIELLILKQLKVGDFVKIGQNTGTVKQIRLFYTIINTIDNRQIIIPNNDIVNNAFENYTAENIRKLDLQIGISYESDIIRAKELIHQVLQEDNRILNDPEPPLVAVSEFASSSIVILVRAWTATADLLDVKFSFLEKIKTTFDKNGIEIPYPKQVIHLRNEN
ncbi:MAG: mechanosensitive ion channel family protein [Candidatus Kapaibacteriota bacterium]